MRRMLSLALVILALTAGCKADAILASGDPATTKFAAELGIDLASMTKTASGLYYKELQAGSGTPAASGQHVWVHYTGWLPDGRQFDTSRDDNVPLEFDLGANQVIPGFDEGVRGMRMGSKRKLVIPSALAYGSRGAGSIPPNSVLVFDVELVGLR